MPYVRILLGVTLKHLYLAATNTALFLTTLVVDSPRPFGALVTFRDSYTDIVAVSNGGTQWAKPTQPFTTSHDQIGTNEIGPSTLLMGTDVINNATTVGVTVCAASWVTALYNCGSYRCVQGVLRRMLFEKGVDGTAVSDHTVTTGNDTDNFAWFDGLHLPEQSDKPWSVRLLMSLKMQAAGM
ncbi:hypothetical protein K488DRAFT_67399 [Vararia minispora EC-137]|uniref:Uncharacterized protein n=1 Tax=Vararia minispora EC-137 TaxID=1314806 RepID=A0ACB8QZS6_9AGAM|nr:hypothetical protein K488DRAFT_67399 [Vararia minispora EC-137]